MAAIGDLSGGGFRLLRVPRSSEDGEDFRQPDVGRAGRGGAVLERVRVSVPVCEVFRDPSGERVGPTQTRPRRSIPRYDRRLGRVHRGDGGAGRRVVPVVETGDAVACVRGLVRLSHFQPVGFRCVLSGAGVVAQRQVGRVRERAVRGAVSELRADGEEPVSAGRLRDSADYFCAVLHGAGGAGPEEARPDSGGVVLAGRAGELAFDAVRDGAVAAGGGVGVSGPGGDAADSVVCSNPGGGHGGDPCVAGEAGLFRADDVRIVRAGAGGLDQRGAETGDHRVCRLGRSAAGVEHADAAVLRRIRACVRPLPLQTAISRPTTTGPRPPAVGGAVVVGGRRVQHGGLGRVLAEPEMVRAARTGCGDVVEQPQTGRVRDEHFHCVHAATGATGVDGATEFYVSRVCGGGA